ncbi:MAG TPA: transglycosylase SLT domain-containing protein, partial [Bryobacteraceae bacterium]|nr:transglycosylase SLT domain-containing protein [Bryobacteraceae bacterium]
MKTLSLAVSLSAVLATGLIFYDFVVTPLSPLLLSRRAHKAPPFTLNEVIRAAARKHGLRPAFIKSVIATESAFNQEALSVKGAIGLMQLMPETAQEYGVDPHDPVQNVEGGAHLLSRLLERYKGHKDQLPRAIAAYNAGPG